MKKGKKFQLKQFPNTQKLRFTFVKKTIHIRKKQEEMATICENSFTKNKRHIFNSVVI